MKLFLDTVSFIWFVDDDPRLSATARSAIVHPNSQVFISAASAWEIVVKYGKGHISLSDTPDRYITLNRLEVAYSELPYCDAALTPALKVRNGSYRPGLGHELRPEYVAAGLDRSLID